jgi:hypothetical protein
MFAARLSSLVIGEANEIRLVRREAMHKSTQPAPPLIAASVALVAASTAPVIAR